MRASRIWHAVLALVVLLAMIVQIVLVVNGGTDVNALLGIVVTGLVYDTVLAPLVHPTGLALWITIAFHYFAPWWTVIGWLLFGPRPRFDDRTVVRAFAWPALWIAYTFARGAVSDWYPYPFLDVTEIGYG